MHALFMLLALAPAEVQPHPCMHYDIPDALIVGQIVRGEMVVAPGQSAGREADFRWYVDANLDVCISGDRDNLDVRAARHIEIWPNYSAHLGQFKGRTVSIRGHFLPTWIPHYHDYPIFAVTTVEVGP
jgi:hypothetical protein